jgi:glycosyl transferase family 25
VAKQSASTGKAGGERLRVHFINLDRSPDRLAQFQAVNGHLSDLERFPAVDGKALDLPSLSARGLVAGDILGMFPVGAVGAALSALALWDVAIETGQSLTIAADDAIFHSRFEQNAAEVIRTLPPDWDFVLWGWNFDLFMSFEMLPDVSHCVSQFDEGRMQSRMRENPKLFQSQPMSPRAFKLLWAFGLPCYTISAKGARAFKDECFPLRPKVVHAPEGAMALSRSDHFRTVGLDATMNGAHRRLNSYVCFPPLVVAENINAKSTIRPNLDVLSRQEEDCRRGDELAREDRLEDALACYDTALAADPGHLRALNNRGLMLHRLRRLDEALVCFERVLALTPSSAEAQFNRGSILQELDRREEAVSSYNSTLALKPDFVPALTHRAWVLRQMRSFDAALASCNQALAIKPDDASAQRIRELILREMAARGS